MGVVVRMQAYEGVFSMEFGQVHEMAYVEHLNVILRTDFLDEIALMLFCYFVLLDSFKE